MTIHQDEDVTSVFVAAAAHHDPDRAEALGRELEALEEPGADEKAIVIRCLTEAATAVRRLVDQDRRPQPIQNGDAAFHELQAVQGLPLDRPREEAQIKLIEALHLAADHLGPFRGGEMGSFKAPGHDPEVIQGVNPTAADLAKMAELSGAAVGIASALSTRVDSLEAVREVAGT